MRGVPIDTKISPVDVNETSMTITEAASEIAGDPKNVLDRVEGSLKKSHLLVEDAPRPAFKSQSRLIAAPIEQAQYASRG